MTVNHFKRSQFSHRASRLVLAAAMLFAALALPGTAAFAARDTEIELDALRPGIVVDGSLQIVVLEAPGCVYCNLFRRYVVPVYDASPRSRDMPLKFIDLNDKAYDTLGLDSPVDLVPTVVLMLNNREVGRIPGYVGPENFFHAINHLLTRVN